MSEDSTPAELIPIELWDRILYFSDDIQSSLLICKLLTITRNYKNYTLQRIVDLYGGESIMNFGVKWCRTNELLVCEEDYYRYYIAGKLLYTYSKGCFWFGNGIELYLSYGFICLPDPKAYNGLVVYQYSDRDLYGVDTGYISAIPGYINYRVYGAPNVWEKDLIEDVGLHTGDVVLDPGDGYWIWHVKKDKDAFQIITRFGISPAVDDIQTLECIKAIKAINNHVNGPIINPIINTIINPNVDNCVDNCVEPRNAERVTDTLRPKKDIIETDEFATTMYIYESLVGYVNDLVEFIKKWNPPKQTLDNPKSIHVYPITLRKLKQAKEQSNYNRIFYY